MDETSLKLSNSVKDEAAMRGAALAQELEDSIRRMVKEDPERARRFLEMLRALPVPKSKKLTFFDTLKAVGILTALLAEARAPSTLRVRPSRLGEVWASVGGYIRHGMGEMDKRLEHHG